jgi:hypothetical protein
MTHQFSTLPGFKRRPAAENCISFVLMIQSRSDNYASVSMVLWPVTKLTYRPVNHPRAFTALNRAIFNVSDRAGAGTKVKRYALLHSIAPRAYTSGAYITMVRRGGLSRHRPVTPHWVTAYGTTTHPCDANMHHTPAAAQPAIAISCTCTIIQKSSLPRFIRQHPPLM